MSRQESLAICNGLQGRSNFVLVPFPASLRIFNIFSASARSTVRGADSILYGSILIPICQFAIVAKGYWPNLLDLKFLWPATYTSVRKARCLMTREETITMWNLEKRMAKLSRLLRLPKPDLLQLHQAHSQTIPSFQFSATAHPRY